MSLPTSQLSWGHAIVDLVYGACALDDEDARGRHIEAIFAREPRIDWERLFDVAESNRVVLQLAEAFETCPSVPAAFRARLTEAARVIKLKNLAMIRELVLVAELMERNGIRAMPLKGPVLAAEFYGDPTRRQFSDLDILVDRADVEQAQRLLRARGYEPGRTSSRAQEREIFHGDCEYELDSSSLGIRIELHWDALPAHQAKSFGVGMLRERERGVQLAGREFPAYLHEDLLLYLCVHGGEKHLWVRLRWLCDVARLLSRQPGLDWDGLLVRAAATGRERTVLLGGYLSWVLLGAPLPAPIVERAIADPWVAAQAGMVHGRLFSLPACLPSFAEWRAFQAVVDEIVLARGFRPRARAGFFRYLATILTPDWTDREALKIPRPLQSLYYLYRPWRLLSKHGVRILSQV